MSSVLRILHRWALASGIALFALMMVSTLVLPHAEAQDDPYALSVRFRNGTTPVTKTISSTNASQ